jgi:protein TonB
MRKLFFVRFCVLLVIAGIHGALFLVTFQMKAAELIEELPARVMKLTNFEEERLEEIIPPPPIEFPLVIQMTNTTETIADTMVETEEDVPVEIVPDFVPLPESISAPVATVQVQEEYLSMHKISVPPVFSEQDLLKRLVYPTIALRSRVEGIVYLELFVDKQGAVQNIVILKEEPTGRGFGEAAIKAFQGYSGTPAHANGIPVAVRYRYPLRFTVR